MSNFKQYLRESIQQALNEWEYTSDYTGAEELLRGNNYTNDYTTDFNPWKDAEPIWGKNPDGSDNYEDFRGWDWSDYPYPDLNYR